MSDGAEKVYKFGPKNNWRRWKWNRISERIKVLPKDALIVYLAGRYDLDRGVAREHGFRDHNMIAIERDPKTAADLRRSGVLTVVGSVDTVLLSWPEKYPIHVADIDLCGGMTAVNCRVPILAACSMTAEGVVSMNLLRGRDAIRKEDLEDGTTNHRGILLYSCLIRWAHEHIRRPITRNGVADVLSRTMPAFSSYKSGKLTYDSAVFCTTGANAFRLKDEATQRQIAAVLAHRTRRLES